MFAMKRKPLSATIKRGRTERQAASGHLAELVLQGAKLKQQLNNIKKELDGVQSDIVGHLKQAGHIGDVGSCHVLVDDIDCTVSIRESLKIINHDILWGILGDRFNDLVREKKTYHPERKLVKMISDGDFKDRNNLRECIESRIGKPAFKYQKIK